MRIDLKTADMRFETEQTVFALSQSRTYFQLYSPSFLTSHFVIEIITSTIPVQAGIQSNLNKRLVQAGFDFGDEIP